MKLRILNSDPAGHWLSVHRADCADLKRLRRSPWNDDSQYPWVEEHASIREAAESIASDFIAEGSMTVEESLQHIHFYPCVALPLDPTEEV